MAAKRGARVILVGKQMVGGTRLNAGCIPTKALTVAADLLVRSRRASDFGLSVPQVAADWRHRRGDRPTPAVDSSPPGHDHSYRRHRFVNKIRDLMRKNAPVCLQGMFV